VSFVLSCYVLASGHSLFLPDCRPGWRRLRYSTQARRSTSSQRLTVYRFAALGACAAPRSEDERLYPGDAVVFKVDEDPPTAQPRVEVMAVVQEDFTVTWLSNKVFTTTGKTYEEFRQEVHDYYVPVLFKNVRLMATDHHFISYAGKSGHLASGYFIGRPRSSRRLNRLVASPRPLIRRRFN